MKTQIQNKVATVLLATISMTGMIACSSQSSNGNSSSTVSAGTLNGVLNNNGQGITNCSQSNANIADLNMQMEVYSSNGTLNENLIRVHFTAFPASFNQAASTIAFFAYGTNSSGSFTQMIQVPFYLEHYTGNSTFTSVSSEMYSLTWQQLSSVASSAGVSNSNAAAALQGITFVIDMTNVVNNYGLQYTEVLSAAIYSKGAGTASAPVAPDRYLQGLVPSFLANPNDYLSTHNQTLVALHPFYSQMSTNNSESQWTTLGNNLCF